MIISQLTLESTAPSNDEFCAECISPSLPCNSGIHGIVCRAVDLTGVTLCTWRWAALQQLFEEGAAAGQHHSVHLPALAIHFKGEVSELALLNQILEVGAQLVPHGAGVRLIICW